MFQLLSDIPELHHVCPGSTMSGCRLSEMWGDSNLCPPRWGSHIGSFSPCISSSKNDDKPRGDDAWREYYKYTSFKAFHISDNTTDFRERPINARQTDNKRYLSLSLSSVILASVWNMSMFIVYRVIRTHSSGTQHGGDVLLRYVGARRKTGYLWCDWKKRHSMEASEQKLKVSNPQFQ